MRLLSHDRAWLITLFHHGKSPKRKRIVLNRPIVLLSNFGRIQHSDGLRSIARVSFVEEIDQKRPA